ncbi:MAG: hypothetical protein H6559_29180 [Lewinellaceae bacterium]|nr:hypothetical protein [Lewinellaceae bacterium]
MHAGQSGPGGYWAGGSGATAGRQPQPVPGGGTIRFYLPEAGPAALEVYNINGQRVWRLEAASLDATATSGCGTAR